MKTPIHHPILTHLQASKISFCVVAPVAARPIGWGMSAASILLLLSCATQQPVGAAAAAIAPPAASIRLEPGPIAVTSPQTPASFNFDKSEGKVEEAGVRASDVAYRVLETPTVAHPQLESAAGAVRFALAPFVAGVAALRVGSERLSSDKLAECEADLARAMAAMAEQRHLRNCVVKSAADKTPLRFVQLDSQTGATPGRIPPSAVLETKVEELRLERTKAGDSSFALLIKARARLLRGADGAVLYDQPFQHRSGTALFVDWTLHHAFQSVADTAYRKLADQMVEQLFAATSTGPMLLGVGYKHAPAHIPDARILFAAHKLALKPRPLSQFASQAVTGSGTIGIYAFTIPNRVAIQMPLTKEEAVSEAISDVEWSLDGLHNSQNSVVQAGAYAAAIPMSLWKQTVGAIHGLTRKQHRAVQASLSAAAEQIQPHPQELAWMVAQQLSPKTSQPVVVVNEPFPSSEGNRPVAVQTGARAVPVAYIKDPSIADNTVRLQGGDTALVIQVRKAALRASEKANPPLALCVEAQVTLRRVSDGEVIYSCPVHYRSAERKAKEWAAHDARLFRQELQDATRQLSGGIVDRLVSQRLIAPDRTPFPALADTSK